MILAQDKEIQALVADIRDGKLLLPEMQRGYVWKSSQVRYLFDSLYHNYPSGQLLIWETDDIPHSRATSLEGSQDSARNPQMLLDGQQRLTSLASIMLGLPLKVRDEVKPIDIVFNLTTEQFAVASLQHRGENSPWISLTKLFTKGAMSVLMEIKLDPSQPESQQVYERLTRLDNIKHYKYRVIVLERLNYEEVTNIFVRINSGGTTLSTADLALAQISSRWRGVTDELGNYLDKLQHRGLEMDVGMLLRAMAVFLTGQSTLSQFFRNERRPITVEELRGVWERVHRSMDQAIDFVVGNCKIDQLRMLPTNYVLVPLAAFFDRLGNTATSQQLRDLQRWVYMALLWNRYSGASETALEQDVTALNRENPIRAMIQNIEDKVGHNRLLNERDLQGQRKNSSSMLLYYVLLRQNGISDWFTGVKIDGATAIDIQPIFSKEVLRKRFNLRKQGLLVDQIANLAVCLPGGGARIGKRPAELYLPDVDPSRLRAHLVPTSPDLWRLENFEQFLLQRRMAIADGINRMIIALTEDPTLWPTSDIQILESRVDAIEHGLRDLIRDRLVDTRGDLAWEQCIPKNIQDYITGRIRSRVEANPYEKGQYETLDAKLKFCQFSDYQKILRSNDSLFEDVFGKALNQGVFEQHMRAVINARNAFKHNNELNRSDLATAEAGLVWFEECLHRYMLLLEAMAADEEIEEEGVSEPS